MSIYRIKKDKDNPYVMVNKALSGNHRLSWKAKGIMLYLLSLPDNWQVYESEITKHATDGIRATRSGIKELIAAGYIHRIQKRTETSQFAGYEYVVHESPQKPLKSTVITKRKNAKQHTTNNNYNNIEKPKLKKGKIIHIHQDPFEAAAEIHQAERVQEMFNQIVQ